MEMGIVWGGRGGNRVTGQKKKKKKQYLYSFDFWTVHYFTEFRVFFFEDCFKSFGLFFEFEAKMRSGFVKQETPGHVPQSIPSSA